MDKFYDYTLPAHKYEPFYQIVKKIVPANMKEEVRADLGMLLFGHELETYELEHGPSPAQVEKLLKQYEASIKKLIDETEKLYPPQRCEETDTERSRIPEWFKPCFEKLESIASYYNDGEAQQLLKNIESFRKGKKTRLHARTYWVSELKKIYELHTGKKAVASKNYPTDFTDFVEAFYKVLRQEGATREHISGEIIEKIIK